ncbi:hypothetical protein D9758_014406 [Tetrapyrgos nigripes]|uniref:DUF6532 domain-containing protein n=1 Tax=Tetrapyrgos nigripes TaxID=182062 RepID=A0A8H5CQP5_9AGAR|nr:hypothetical protein D9758_014406 [Tetrapyrgos nigripes]
MYIVWLEAEHKRRPTTNPCPALRPKSKPKTQPKLKAATSRARTKKSERSLWFDPSSYTDIVAGVSNRKKTSARPPVVHVQSDDEDEGEEDGEAESEDEELRESDEEDDKITPQAIILDLEAPIDDSFPNSHNDEMLEDDAFVVPRSQSRASSISLPPAGELSEDDDDEDAGRKRKSPPTEQSDAEDDGPEPKKSRVEKFLSERPQIVSSVTKSLQKTAIPAEKKPVVWPEITEYTPLAAGARLLSKGKQPPHFKALLEKASVNAVALFLFDTAYPDPKKKVQMLTDALTMASSDLQQTDIHKRLLHPAEEKYKKPLEDYIFNRVVHARGEVQKSVTSIILSAYPITGADNEDLPTYLGFLRKKCRYIYPQVITVAEPAKPNLPTQPSTQLPTQLPMQPETQPDFPVSQAQPRNEDIASRPEESPSQAANAPVPTSESSAQRSRVASKIDEKSLKKSQPYKHSAITSVLKTLFAGYSSPGFLYQELFGSTLPNNDEKEIPKAMLAMVASVSGEAARMWPKPSRQTLCEPSTKKHSDLLDKIAANPQKYHRLMADLYRIASGDSDNDGDTSDDGVPDINLDELAG